jgi:molecular chaperone Hsp33
MSKIKFDQLHRYIFPKANVRGELVRLNESYAAILSANDYPPIIQQLLGELMLVASLLTATLKFEGDIAVQLQGDGPLKYAVINGTHEQKLRGVARWDDSLSDFPEDFAGLFVKGLLVITISPRHGERYQGMVAVDKPSLAECIEAYFLQSEQLATSVLLHTRLDKSHPMAAGMFLQILPTSSAVTDSANIPQFDHLLHITKTIKEDELFSLSADEILHRLYHQEELQVFEPQDVCFKCSCSKERSATAIASVDKQELLEIIAKEGMVSMNCQYCHAEYQFDAIDVEGIHAGTYSSQPLTQ